MDPNNHIAAAELGLRPIHLASLDGDLETVVVLASEDNVIDVLTEPQTGADWRLRETPIKLAALMGHLSLVEFFIDRRASLVHDNVRNDTHASSYAREDGLAEQRRDFYLRTIQIGRENLDAVNARKTIYQLLSSPGRRSVLNAMRGPRADLGYADYRLGKQGRNIVVYAPVYRIKTDITLQRNKTIGVITVKGQGDVLMAAHSGFRLGGDHDEKCLDTNQWNYIALHHIAALIKFKFPGNLHDNGARPVEDDAHRGRAHAGHVEVLLASWYSLEMARRVTGNQGASTDWLLARLHRVKPATTLGAARCAVIMIDHQPCATCLKFINRLYQYTGIYFAVLGSVGVGPTLATKDPRDHFRLDTFGDVFPVSDGEEEMDEGGDDEDEVEEVVPETPAVVRNPAGRARDTMADKPSAQPIINQPFPWMADPRRTPERDSNMDDIAHAAQVVMEQIARTGPTTPARPRMAWPVPGAGSSHRQRRANKDDPFTPSRRPENHLELLAEYKKKTPVWQWPGYEATVAQMRSEDLQRRLAAASAEATPCPEDANHHRPGVVGGDTSAGDEDMIIVDLDDSDDADAAAYSPDSGGRSTHQGMAVAAAAAAVKSRMSSREEEAAAPRSPLMDSKVFLYSSFVPIPRTRGDDEGPRMQQAPRPDFRMQTDDSGHDNSGADDEDEFCLIGPSSQRARVGDSSMEEEADEEMDMVSTPFPPAKTLSFTQWKYEPRAKHARANARGNAPEAPMFQPRPIPNFRGLHRLGR
ncbi:hypothetical protein F4818DRAFT_330868 [Hypoxylon cercidicola]|nr:hypothetical protein F4818DRAFT_330868 [Hypoxylon cercidicola]